MYIPSALLIKQNAPHSQIAYSMFMEYALYLEIDKNPCRWIGDMIEHIMEVCYVEYEEAEELYAEAERIAVSTGAVTPFAYEAPFSTSREAKQFANIVNEWYAEVHWEYLVSNTEAALQHALTDDARMRLSIHLGFVKYMQGEFCSGELDAKMEAATKQLAELTRQVVNAVNEENIPSEQLDEALFMMQNSAQELCNTAERFVETQH